LAGAAYMSSWLLAGLSIAFTASKCLGCCLRERLARLLGSKWLAEALNFGETITSEVIATPAQIELHTESRLPMQTLHSEAAFGVVDCADAGLGVV
jgi:hypothetical protein